MVPMSVPVPAMIVAVTASVDAEATAPVPSRIFTSGCVLSVTPLKPPTGCACTTRDCGARGSFTEIVAEPETPPADAVIVAVPTETAVATPALSTVATEPSLELHEGTRPLIGLLAWSRTVAVNTSPPPVNAAAAVGSTAIEPTGGRCPLTEWSSPEQAISATSVMGKKYSIALHLAFTRRRRGARVNVPSRSGFNENILLGPQPRESRPHPPSNGMFRWLPNLYVENRPVAPLANADRI